MFRVYANAQSKTVTWWDTPRGGWSSFLSKASRGFSLWGILASLRSIAQLCLPVCQTVIHQYAHHLLLVWSPAGWKSFSTTPGISCSHRFSSWTTLPWDVISWDPGSWLTLLHVNSFEAEQFHWLDSSKDPVLMPLEQLSLNFNAVNDGGVRPVCLVLSPLCQVQQTVSRLLLGIGAVV